MTEKIKHAVVESVAESTASSTRRRAEEALAVAKSRIADAEKFMERGDYVRMAQELLRVPVDCDVARLVGSDAEAREWRAMADYPERVEG